MTRNAIEYFLYAKYTSVYLAWNKMVHLQQRLTSYLDKIVIQLHKTRLDLWCLSITENCFSQPDTPFCCCANIFLISRFKFSTFSDQIKYFFHIAVVPADFLSGGLILYISIAVTIMSSWTSIYSNRVSASSFLSAIAPCHHDISLKCSLIFSKNLCFRLLDLLTASVLMLH